MKNYLLVGLTLLTVIGFAHAQDAITIPKLTEAITVDGDLSDWPQETPLTVDSSMTADATDVADDNDLSMTVYTGYDDAHFYLGAEVTDDALVFEKSSDAIAENDAVEFWLNANQYGVALVEGQPVLHQWLFSGTESDLSAAEVAFEYTDTGYIVEVSLPLEVLASATETDAQAGSSFPFAVGADDADEEGGARLGQVYYPDSWTWSEPDTYATATLGE